MENAVVFALFPWHKSFGVIVILFAVIRIGWRVKEGWLKPVNEYSTTEKKLSKITHWVLILSTVVMPASGFMMSAMGGNGVEVFGLELVAKNTSSSDAMEIIPINESMAGFAHNIHGLGGNVLLLAVLRTHAGRLRTPSARQEVLTQSLGLSVSPERNLNNHLLRCEPRQGQPAHALQLGCSDHAENVCHYS